MHIWTLSCTSGASWAPVTYWTDHPQPLLPTHLHSSRLPANYIILPTDLRYHCHRHPPHLTNRLWLLVMWTHLGGIRAGHSPWTVIQTAGRPPRSLSPSARPISSPSPETSCVPAT
uniref:DKFZP564B147 protein n=1 Tax=Homo sapiens TaxID=9606 RepID=Q6IAN1_HUMAN